MMATTTTMATGDDDDDGDGSTGNGVMSDGTTGYDDDYNGDG